MKRPISNKGEKIQLSLLNYGYDTNEDLMMDKKMIELTKRTLTRIAEKYLEDRGCVLNDTRLIPNDRKLVMAVETRVRPIHQESMRDLFGDFKLEFQVGWLVE